MRHETEHMLNCSPDFHKTATSKYLLKQARGKEAGDHRAASASFIFYRTRRRRKNTHRTWSAASRSLVSRHGALNTKKSVPVITDTKLMALDLANWAFEGVALVQRFHQNVAVST